MKWFLVFLAILVVKVSAAQKKDTLSQQFLESVVPLIVDYQSVAMPSNESLVASYADSINNYNGSKPPSFIFNKCLDTRGPSFFRGFHGGPSFRWKILEKVNNKTAIVLLMDKYAKELKRKCRRDKIKGKYAYINVDLIDFSFYQLMEVRLAELD